MTKERLNQILVERESNHAAYISDGWKYFDEAIDDIKYAIFVREEDLEIHKAEKEMLSPKIVTPVVKHVEAQKKKFSKFRK